MIYSKLKSAIRFRTNQDFKTEKVTFIL